MNLQLTVTKVKQLGNFHSKPHPILIELPLMENVMMVLKSKSNIQNFDK